MSRIFEKSKHHTNKQHFIPWVSAGIILCMILLYVTTFLLPMVPIAHAAAARVQTVAAGNDKISSVSATWSSSTTAGNLLVAIIGVRKGSSITITPPSGGWTLAVRSDNGTTLSTVIYYIANAASQSNTSPSTWTLSSIANATLTLVEYSGINTTSPLDQTATAAGTSTTADSGITATTSQVNEVAVAGLAVAKGDITFSAQTNGFTEVSEVASTAGAQTNNTVLEEKILLSTGTQQVQATISGDDDWAGAIATFKAATVATTYKQSAYRLFDNTNSTDVGTALVAQDTPASLGVDGDAFRLRLLLHVGGSNLGINGGTFKLQFAERSGTCDAAFSGETYTDVTSLSTIAYNDNSTPLDGDNLTANASDPAHGIDTVVNQDYEEANNFTNSVAAIDAGQDGKWDFSLIDNDGTASKNYCFRVVKLDGSLLDTYTVIPEVTTAVAVDTTSPTVSSAATASTTTIDLTMSESVVDNAATAGDFTVSGAASSPTVSSIGVAGSTVTLNLSAGILDSETITVSYTQTTGSIDDSAGNSLTNFTGQAVTNNLDTTAPTPAITTTEASPTNANPVPFTINFGEAINTGTFTTADITVSSGTVQNLVNTGDDQNYTFDIASPADGTTLSVSIAAGTLTDVVGNSNLVSNTVNISIDRTSPTVSLSSTASDPTNTSPIPMTATFGESVTGFALADITVGNGVAGNLLGSGASYTFDVTPSADGAVTVDIPSGGAQDSAGNGNTAASQFGITYDSSAPTITEVTPIASLANDTTPNYTFNTDEAGDITYGGDCSSTTISAALGNNTIALNTLADGTHSNCTLTVTDSVGNVSSTLNISSFTIDATAPTGAGNSSPANASIDIPLTQTLTATTAADANTIEYYFEIAEDNLFTIAVQNSGWQSGTIWNPSLSKSKTYYWHIKVRDSLVNESNFGSIFWFSTISGYTFANISTSISLVDETDLTTEFTDGTYSGVETVVVKDAEGYVVGKFVIDFSTALNEIDMTGLIADTDFTQYKSVLHDSNWPTEVYSSKTLYIPSTGVGSVYICPGATSLTDVRPNCTGGVNISVGQTVNGMTVSTTTIGDQEYYEVSGISGTGGGESNPPISESTPIPGGVVPLYILSPPPTVTPILTITPTSALSPTPTPTPIPTPLPESEITPPPSYLPEVAPSAISSLAFNRNLSLGNVGDDVRVLQQFLNQNGFILAETGPGSPGSETNYFGSLTEAALARYQQAYADYILAPLGLTEGTGFFGPSTRNYITSASFLTPTLSLEPSLEREPVIPAPIISAVVFTRNLWVGDNGDDIQALQQFLNQEGFTVAPEGYGSPGNETEDFGLRTKEALIRFQEANAVRILSPFGLTEGTGFFGSSTRAFINSLLSE